MDSRNGDFVARYRWPVRLIPVAMIVIAAYAAPRSMAEWKEQSASLQAGWLFFGAVLVGSLAEVLLRRTRFSDRWIERRTMLGSHMRRGYDEIRGIESRREEFLDVEFADGRRLRVWALEGNLDALRAFLVRKVEALPDGRRILPAGQDRPG